MKGESLACSFYSLIIPLRCVIQTMFSLILNIVPRLAGWQVLPGGVALMEIKAGDEAEGQRDTP